MRGMRAPGTRAPGSGGAPSEGPRPGGPRAIALAVLTVMALTAALAPARPAAAHETLWNRTDSERTVTISFIYSDRTPMAYSQIKVWSPADPAIEYQNARTDRSGNFAFVPDVPGRWTFKVDDGQGHLAEGAIDVAF